MEASTSTDEELGPSSVPEVDWLFWTAPIVNL
jgi:hypothetical protein